MFELTNVMDTLHYTTPEAYKGRGWCMLAVGNLEIV